MLTPEASIRLEELPRLSTSAVSITGADKHPNKYLIICYQASSRNLIASIGCEVRH